MSKGKRKSVTSGGVDGMLDAVWERKVRNGEPCTIGMCGRVSGVRRPDGTMGKCPTCERQDAIWERVGNTIWHPDDRT